MTVPVSRRHFLTGAAAAFPAALIGWRSGPVVASDAPAAVEVNARRIENFDPRDSSHVRFGSLEFRGGLVLTSPFKGFGGLSALRLDDKGERFTALSDKGDWFIGRIVYDHGKLAGWADVQSAPILGPDGKPTRSRGWFDTESLTFDGSTAYVGLERVNQILRFDFGKDGMFALGQPIPVPAGIGKLPFNRGLESLVCVPQGRPLGGTLIAISEEGLDEAGNIRGFLIGGPSPGEFTVARSRNFDISDATLLPSNDLLLLERKYSPLEGVAIRIRRVPLASVAPGAVLDGPAIFDVDMAHEIDNMECIDTHVADNGETVVTMLSDDNFSVVQRTLMLQFTLLSE